MARINVEDSIYRDPRFIDLCIKLGSRAPAIGWCVIAWDLAQKWYLKSESKTVPHEEWAKAGVPPAFLEVGLGLAGTAGVHVCGVEKYASWVEKCRTAGRAGRAKQLNKVSGEPPALARGQRASSSSSSIQIQKKEEETLRVQESASALPVIPGSPGELIPIPMGRKPKFSELTRAKMRAFIAAYADGWKKKYGGAPEGLRDKGVVGKLGHWIEMVSEDRALLLVEAYLLVDYRPISESMHDLWQFFRHLNRIGAALDSGRAPGEVDWSQVFGGAA